MKCKHYDADFKRLNTYINQHHVDIYDCESLLDQALYNLNQGRKTKKKQQDVDVLISTLATLKKDLDTLQLEKRKFINKELDAIKCQN